MPSLDELAQKAGVQPLNPTSSSNLDWMAEHAGVKPLSAQSEPPQKEGFWSSVAKGIAKPFVQAGVTAMGTMEGAANLGAAGLNKLIGHEDAAQQNLQRANQVTTSGYNVPGFGQVAPEKIGTDVAEQDQGAGAFNKNTLHTLGTGAEIGSWGMGGGAAEDVIGNVAKGAWKTAAAKGALEGAAAGAAQGFGVGAQQEKPTARGIAADTIAGAVGGGTIGGLVPGAGAVAKEVKEIVNPGVEALLTKGVRPVGQAAQKFSKTLSRALPELEKYAGQVKDLRSLDAAIKARKAEIWKEVKSHVGAGMEKGLGVNGDSIADEMMAAARGNSKMIRENPDLMEKLKAKADAYRGTIDPVEAEDLLEQTNAHLQSYYAKNKTSQALAEKADPEIAMELKLAAGLRQGLDNVLGEHLGQFGNLKDSYGALSELGSQVQKRIPVAERQNIMSLNEQLGIGRAIGNAGINLVAGRPVEAVGGLAEIGAAHALKGLEMSDSKVNRAFRMLEKKSPKGEAPRGLLDKASDIINSGKFPGMMKTEAVGVGPTTQIPKIGEDAFKNFPDLSTKILGKLEGKKTVSKQFISDLTNSGDVKQAERDIIRQALESEGEKVNVKDFADKVKQELLPLNVSNSRRHAPELESSPRYEYVSLPEEVKGNVAKYKENVYQSPVQTSAGGVHFGDNAPNYFGHTRVEDMADGSTRRVIEVQSDLYQKGRLEGENAAPKKAIYKEKEYPINGFSRDTVTLGDPKNPRQSILEPRKEEVQFVPTERSKEVARLQQYNDPTAHFRMIREEVKKAAEDGKKELLFPTGETAMKVEGLGGNSLWTDSATGERLQPQQLKVGQRIRMGSDDMGEEAREFVVTEVKGNGKFKAIPEDVWDLHSDNEPWKPEFRIPEKVWSKMKENAARDFESRQESFDISDSFDKNNPIHKFYEKEVGKYLKSKYGATPFTDENGVTWWKVNLKPEHGKLPVEAFGLVPAAAAMQGKKQKQSK